MTTTPHANAAIRQLIDTFGSETEFLEQFDNLLHRLTLAYGGSAQPMHCLVGDYDFIHQLKQAIRLNMQNP